jgi:hypothetical protein
MLPPNNIWVTVVGPTPEARTKLNAGGQAAAAAQAPTAKALTAQADGMKPLMSRYHVKSLAVASITGRWDVKRSNPDWQKSGVADP